MQRQSYKGFNLLVVTILLPASKPVSATFRLPLPTSAYNLCSDHPKEQYHIIYPKRFSTAEQDAETHYTMAEQSEYVTLISSDGYSFVVQRSSACISGAIKRMLDPSCTSRTTTFLVKRAKLISANRWLCRVKNKHMPFRKHQVSQMSTLHRLLKFGERYADQDFATNSGLVLEKVCEYFYYNEKHKNSKDVPDIDVPAELCLELLMAADYLNGAYNFHTRRHFAPDS